MTKVALWSSILLAGCAGQRAETVVAPKDPEPRPVEGFTAEPLMPAQYAEGAGEARDAIYARADAVVKYAEAAAAELDLEATGAWPRILEQLKMNAERLAEAGFHDGALGPGTAMLQPGPYIERVRRAYRMGEAEYLIPGSLPARTRSISDVSSAIGLAQIIVRNPDRLTEADRRKPFDEMTFVAWEQEEGPIEVEILADLDPDIAKWVGGAMPRSWTDGPRLLVDGPPALRALVADVVASQRHN